MLGMIPYTLTVTSFAFMTVISLSLTSFLGLNISGFNFTPFKISRFIFTIWCAISYVLIFNYFRNNFLFCSRIKFSNSIICQYDSWSCFN